jgi:ubiquitin-activating enzyme E1
VGKRRSVSVRDALAQLNTFVDVQAHTGELNEAFISNFHAVVVTDAAMPRKDLVRFSAFCHSRRLPHLNPQSGQQELLPAPIAFFYAVTRGVTASLFVDLGPEHTVTDADGQPVKSHVVEHISRSGVVTIGGGKDQHGLDDGDLVRFEEVQGMEALNKMEPIPIKRIKVADKKRTRVVGDRFQLAPEGGEFKVAGEYVNGGIVTQVKRPVTVRFEPLEQQLVHPALLPHMDSSRAGTDAVAQLHIAQLALFEFAEKSGGLPRLHSDEDAKQCVALAQDVLRAHKAVQGAVTVEAVDAKVVTNMALFARAELTGLCAFLGGIVAQEVIKVPGKFSPIRQWFHHDQFQLVPNGVPPDAAPQKSRYDHQIAIFGRAAHAKLCSQKWFVVGAGALGCEYLKGFALMGVGSGKGGALIVTDMDTVEISNLSRQFLFRKDNVGEY